MSEQTTKSLSISFRVDDGVIDHNNRTIIAKNVDASRVSDNVIYVQKDIRKLYQEVFGEALEKYNAAQKRRDKKIPDYFEHICKSHGNQFLHLSKKVFTNVQKSDIINLWNILK